MKMTSRIYGIAVKETVDYYEYDDIKLQFNQDTKHWSVFSNYDNVWFNGTQYTKGSLILMFSDYAIAEYAIMAQYTDTTPYTNYIYRIVTNAKVNPASLQNGRIEYIFEADPEEEPYTFTCKMVVNNVQQKKFTVTDVDIKTYKNQNNGKLPTLFTDLKMDWHGMNPEAPYLPYSFTIIANNDYIKDGVTEIPKGEIVLQIPAGIGQGSYYHRILDETNIHEVKPEPGELPSVIMYKKLGRYNARPSVTFTRETIIRKVYHDHTKVYYNGHYHKAMYLVVDSPGSNVGCWKKVIKGLNFTYADPFWFCMTSATGIEMNGHVYGTKQLVKCWKDTDPVNMVLTKTTSRKKATPENAPYDDIIYDVVSNETNVTVTRIRRKTHIDTSGHKTTEDIQEGLPIVFDTSNSPVLCWNIEFKAKNNIWTIYSKCGYIRYGGRQYPKNRSILEFNAGEEMHIEIKDETEKYEVQEILTYRISNVTATAFMYKVWTVGTSYTIKVEKSIPGQDPEPWVTINFYDAIYESVIVDDIQIDFDNSKRIWILSSASDNLYSYDKKIDKGEVIAEWGLNTVFSMKDDRAINVILPNSEMDVRVRVESNLTDLKGIDVSDFLPKDLGESSYMDILVTHSVNKGLWVVTSKNDNTYVNGTRYTYNKEIFSCSDKQGMSEIDIMCQHKKDESGQPISPYINWHYFISIYYDTYEQRGTMLIDCKKQATPPQTGWVTVFSQTYYTKEKEDAQDQRKNNIILTKQNCKSMYGYIWKRDMPGPGPTTVVGIMLEIHSASSPSRGYQAGIFVYDVKRQVVRTVEDDSRLSWPPYDDPFAVQLRTIYYQLDRVNNIVYINYSDSAFKNGYYFVNLYSFLGRTLSKSCAFWESATIFVISSWSVSTEDPYKTDYTFNRYLVYQGTLELIDSIVVTNVYGNTSGEMNYRTGAFDKTSNGCYVIAAPGYIAFLSSTINNNYKYDGIYEKESWYRSRFEELYDYIAGMYPGYSGHSGEDYPGQEPHIDGYSWGVDSASSTYIDDYERPPFLQHIKDPDGNYIVYVKLTVGQYIHWYTTTTRWGETYWNMEQTPVGITYLIAIKFSKSTGVPSFYRTDNNIILDCFGNVDGKLMNVWASYEYNNDLYCIIPKCNNESPYTTTLLYVCKLNKETCFFEVVKTINQEATMDITMYNSAGNWRGERTFNVIGGIIPLSSSLYRRNPFANFVEILSDDTPLSSKRCVISMSNYNDAPIKFYFDNPLFNKTSNTIAIIY